jgi:excinuclease ABC subunit A
MPRPAHPNGILRIRGARVHSLRGIDVDIPKDRFVVLTGVSGSGKSSLAFDTLYAEGQRRYVESLSAYARQFLQLAQKPDVDAIEGLTPAIAIEQKTTSWNPRSTVGTTTEIHDHMRVLWARVGIAVSPATGHPIEAVSPSESAERLIAWAAGRRVLVLAPAARRRKGAFGDEIAAWRRAGWQRLRIDGQIVSIDAVPPIDPKKPHDVDVVVDRIQISQEARSRAAEAIEAAFRVAEGQAEAVCADSGEVWTFSAHATDPATGRAVPPLEPRLFSFNSPVGACPTCDGLGVLTGFDPDLLLPDPAQSAGEQLGRALDGGPLSGLRQAMLRRLGRDAERPWGLVPEARRARYLQDPDEGLLSTLERLLPSLPPATQWRLSFYRSDRPCPACHGARLRPEALWVQVDGRRIDEVAAWSVAEARAWFSGLSGRLDGRRRAIAERLVREIVARLGFLEEVGLSYLSLDRPSSSLSGGESQRIRLASQVGAGLGGILYVLDEPSIGLHPSDNGRLIRTLQKVRDLGNTVVVVEHDEETMRAADWIVELGPGAGKDGGRIVAEGPPARLAKSGKGLTGQYLSGRRRIPLPERRRSPDGRWLVVRGARGHTLRGIDARIPLGLMVGVAGPSGSGKSTLIDDTLRRALARRFHDGIEAPLPHAGLEGVEAIDKLVAIDQTPIGRTPRSNPGTYTGALDPIRAFFADLPDARARGWTPGRFSFNVKGGRCEACEGEGIQRISMHFLPDVEVPCDVCGGARFNRETLEVRYRGKTIADVLAMTVAEARDLFQAHPHVRRGLDLLVEVGLGYVPLGQPATTLSGGEAQRVKLAAELARRPTGRTLYLLDEPTTGLHAEDVARLLGILEALVARGNTVLLVEHNLDVLKRCDWILELGPGGGADGGQIVAEGPPEVVAVTAGSPTGPYLAKALSAASQHSVSPHLHASSNSAAARP